MRFHPGLFAFVFMLQLAVPARAATTMGGIYSTAQARRGEETYMGLCVSCHPLATYTGPAFIAAWGTRPLSDLYGFISEKMPKSDPGSLAPDEVAQVTAYILKLNRVPAGTAELPADSTALSQISIELPGMQAK